jgi:hypothetical protein
MAAMRIWSTDFTKQVSAISISSYANGYRME